MFDETFVFAERETRMKPRRKSWRRKRRRMERETTALHQPVYCATAATTETTPPLPFSHSPASRGVLKPTIISVFHPKLLFIKDLLWRIPPLRPGPEPTKPVSLSLCCGWRKFSPPPFLSPSLHLIPISEMALSSSSSFSVYESVPSFLPSSGLCIFCLFCRPSPFPFHCCCPLPLLPLQLCHR